MSFCLCSRAREGNAVFETGVETVPRQNAAVVTGTLNFVSSFSLTFLGLPRCGLCDVACECNQSEKGVERYMAHLGDAEGTTTTTFPGWFVVFAARWLSQEARAFEEERTV